MIGNAALWWKWIVVAFLSLAYDVRLSTENKSAIKESPFLSINDPLTPLSCEDIFSSDCSQNKKINSMEIFPNTSCTFNCSYTPTSEEAIELDVHQLSSVKKGKVFVSARQNYELNSWVLPIVFPEHGVNQYYSSIEALLCPPFDKNKGKETIFFRLETEYEDGVTINVTLKKQRLKIEKELNVTVTVTPVSPWYKYYEWGDQENAILVTADNVKRTESSVCALLSLQDGKCPVAATKETIIAGGGRYQSFQKSGGMVAKKDRFPNGVFIVVLTLSDDSLCTERAEDFGNHTTRHKSIKLRILPHTTIGSNYGIYLAVFLGLAMLMVASHVGIIWLIYRNFDHKNPELRLDGEEEGLLSNENNIGRRNMSVRGVAMGGIQVIFGGVNHSDTGGGGRNDDAAGDQNLEEGEERLLPPPQGVEERLRAITADDSNVTSSGDVTVWRHQVPDVVQPLPEEIVNVSNQSNPCYVYWWKLLAEHKNQGSENDVGAIGFQRNLILVAVFMALPFVEILKSYLHAFTNTGSEDQCFFNSKCITSFWIFSDFSRVFTNIAYLFCAISFLGILRTHRILNWKISAAETLGVSRNYGLFTSLGLGLIIQAVMSSMYHVCPNTVTLRLDMIFMYVDAVVLIVGVWGLRHCGVSHHVYPTVGLISVALLLAEFREFVSPGLFWFFAVMMHLTLMFTIGTMLWKFGTWSFVPSDIVSIWKEWKPIMSNLHGLLREETSTTASIFGFFRASVGVIVNLAILICAATLDIEVYMYILAVCIANMAMYVLNYVSLKLLHNEKGTLVSWICLGVAAVLWICAISFFFMENTDIETTPSVSRSLNSGCILFGILDYHDLWHIFSALAMFYTIVGILTLDDDLARRDPTKIPTF